MKRKSALATAAAITGTLFAAGAATALNSAILGGAADASPGGAPSVLATANNDEIVETPTSVTVTTVAASPATVATLPTIRSTGADPESISAGSSVASGGDDDDREHEDEHEGREHEGGEHEYEGSDDDD